MNIKQRLSVLATVLLVVFTINTAQAQQSGNNIGLGVMVGEPTGLSFKAWTSGTTAFDAALAWSLEGRDRIHIHADHLWHNFDVFGGDIDPGQLPVYYGIGGRLILVDDEPDPDGDDNDAIFGVRVPVGINYLFENNPIGLFLEVAPTINLIPDTDLDADAALGIRFYL